jgi:hypothetical protein
MGCFFELKPSLILQIFSPVFVHQIHLQKRDEKEGEDLQNEKAFEII